MTTYNERAAELKKKLDSCKTPQDLHHKIIDLGRKLPPMPTSYKTEENLIPGCQSLLYLHTAQKDGKMTFLIASDALISAGLAALLREIYEGLPPLEIAENKPTFLQDLGILPTLSPSRINGVANLYLKMKSESLKF